MKSIDIPWGAWYGDGPKTLTFPDDTDIQVAELAERPPLTDSEISQRLETLLPLIRQKKPRRIAIVVDDLTRPLKT